MLNAGAGYVEVLSTRLKSMRRARGWSQEELADRAGGGIDQSQISAWETGRKRPSMENVAKLAHAFDMEHEDLLREFGYIEPARGKNGVGHDPGDIFDRAPLSRLDAELKALPTAPGQPTFADQMRQLDRLPEDRRARVVRRLARDFLWRLREELEREEEGD